MLGMFIALLVMVLSNASLLHHIYAELGPLAASSFAKYWGLVVSFELGVVRLIAHSMECNDKGDL